MNKQLEFKFNKEKENLANKIVDKNYKDKKVKPVFTQIADNARDLLSYKYNSTTGKFANNDDEISSASEAVKVNDALEKNFQDHKRDDYLNRLKKFGVEESSIKQPGYPKVSNQPILKNNINNKLTPLQRRKQNYLKTWGIEDGPHNPDLRNIIRKAVNEADEEKKNNPTVNKYKAFRENQKKQLEEKKFDEHMEREYGPKAMSKYMRAKENKNRMAGKAPYENFSTSDIIVAEDIKEKAKKQLKSIQLPTSTTGFTDFMNYKEALNREPIKPMPTLDEYMAARAPKEDAGITGLKNVEGMKSVVDYSNKAFNLNNSKGIGPFLTGEDDE